MRVIGPVLILVGALATIPAMFIPLFEGYETGSLNWWETFQGLDVVLAGACGIAALLALASLTTGHRTIRQLAGIAAAVTFGLAFTFVPDRIGSGEYEGAKAGLWIVAATGAIALAGAVVIAASKSD
jgi:hypothetical protein